MPSFQNLKGFDIYDAFNVIDYHVDFMVKKLKILRDHTAKTYPDDRIFDIISEALELSETLAVENEDWSDKGVFCLGCEVTNATKISAFFLEKTINEVLDSVASEMEGQHGDHDLSTLRVFFVDKDKRDKFFEELKYDLDFRGLCGNEIDPDADTEESMKKFKLHVRRSAVRKAVSKVKDALDEKATKAQKRMDQASEAKKMLGARLIGCFGQEDMFNAYEIRQLTHPGEIDQNDDIIDEEEDTDMEDNEKDEILQVD